VPDGTLVLGHIVRGGGRFCGRRPAPFPAVRVQGNFPTPVTTFTNILSNDDRFGQLVNCQGFVDLDNFCSFHSPAVAPDLVPLKRLSPRIYRLVLAACGCQDRKVVEQLVRRAERAVRSLCHVSLQLPYLLGSPSRSSRGRRSLRMAPHGVCMAPITSAWHLWQGFRGIALTVDTPILGRREADLRNK